MALLRTFLLPLLLLSFTLGGCSTIEDITGSSDEDDMALDEPPREQVQAFAGSFEIRSKFDLTQSGLIPDLAAGTLQSLSGLSENPSGTMFAVVSQAGVPIAATVIDLTPSFLANIIDGIINGLVFETIFKALPVTERLTHLVGDIARVFTEFELVSILDIAPPDEAGNTTISHRLVGVVFRFDGEEYTVRAPEIVSDVTAQVGIEANAAVLYHSGATLEDGRLYLADHEFTIPVGALAVAGIDFALQKAFEVEDLRAALGSFISCPAIGAGVASYCPGGTCSALGDAIDSLCSSALDLVASNVEDSLTAIEFDFVQFSSGEAAFFDLGTGDVAEKADEQMDRIERGHWSIQFGTGEDAVIIPGVFEGRRIGDEGAEG